ncbi:MAG: MauE/DoxX family redox-associated membrane protein [Candidatus Acidiferrales bacterium]
MNGSSRWGTGRILLLLGRLGLAVIFLVAAYGKLRPQNAASWTLSSLKITPASLGLSMTFFAFEVDSYHMLPEWGANLVARTLPWAELALVILLLAGIGLRYVAAVTTLLLTALLAVVIRAYALHLVINCGCFGPNEKLDGWTLARDGSFVALGLAVTIGAFIIDRRNRLAASALSRTELPAS